jgi:hypothetical protein
MSERTSIDQCRRRCQIEFSAQPQHQQATRRRCAKLAMVRPKYRHEVIGKRCAVLFHMEDDEDEDEEDEEEEQEEKTTTKKGPAQQRRKRRPRKRQKRNQRPELHPPSETTTTTTAQSSKSRRFSGVIASFTYRSVWDDVTHQVLTVWYHTIDFDDGETLDYHLETLELQNEFWWLDDNDRPIMMMIVKMVPPVAPPHKRTTVSNPLASTSLSRGGRPGQARPVRS